jgi:16S rRNA (cytosine967-C5)-methyltransferase
MRIHRNLAYASGEIIRAVFDEKKVLDRVLSTSFRANPKWGKRDRAFIAETVFEVVRWRRALGFVAQCEKIEALCAAQWIRMGFEVPEWWVHDGADGDTIRSLESNLEEQARAVRASIPDWIDTLGEEELGDKWNEELSALNQRAEIYLRVNTLKTSRSDAILWLNKYGVIAKEVPELPDALVLLTGQKLPKSLREDGRVEIQDAGSQMIAPLLGAQHGETVIDACAGAGGKALHLAALMQNKGQIIAMDIAPKKLLELERRSKRSHPYPCIETHIIDPKTVVNYKETADRILIDAPCSGMGTLKRQPDLKWRLTPDSIKSARAIQYECLDAYSEMLKSGGCLVYATCSVLPSENRGNIDRLLQQGKFELSQECTLSPAKNGYDGFYAAVLMKK